MDGATSYELCKCMTRGMRNSNRRDSRGMEDQGATGEKRTGGISASCWGMKLAGGQGHSEISALFPVSPLPSGVPAQLP